MARRRSIRLPAAAGPVAAGAGAARFRDDEAGLRALLLEQRADGLFVGDLATTALAVAVLVSRGHTARAGSFRAELRRTTTAAQGRLASASGDDRLLCVLVLALLRMPHGEAPPADLPPFLADLLQGRSLSDLAALAAAIRVVISKTPGGFWHTPLCQQLMQTFLKP